MIVNSSVSQLCEFSHVADIIRVKFSLASYRAADELVPVGSFESFVVGQTLTFKCPCYSESLFVGECSKYSAKNTIIKQVKICAE